MVYDIDTDIGILFITPNLGGFGRLEKPYFKGEGIY